MLVCWSPHRGLSRWAVQHVWALTGQWETSLVPTRHPMGVHLVCSHSPAAGNPKLSQLK